MASKPTTLAVLREAAGLTQGQLGELIAKPGSTTLAFQPRIYSYESGRKRIPLPVASEIVKVLNKHLRRRKSKLIANVEHLVHESHK